MLGFRYEVGEMTPSLPPHREACRSSDRCRQDITTPVWWHVFLCKVLLNNLMKKAVHIMLMQRPRV